MSYPQVSFEIKTHATLETFSNRNGIPGRAALVRGEKPTVCVNVANWEPDSALAKRPGRAGSTDDRGDAENSAPPGSFV